jgi:outer membrane protein OmpA-like peptidoglycan-associated protein
MKKAVLPIGLAALAILAWFCIRSHAPFIQKDIFSRTETALKSAGFQFASVSVNGRDVRIEGAAPDEAALKAAKELATGVWGVRFVDAAMTVAKAPEPPAPKAAEASATPPPSKWTFDLDRSSDKISLAGMLPNEAMRDRFVQILQPLAGAGGLDQRITLIPESPEAWRSTVAAIAQYLDDFTRLKAELSGDALRIAGEMNTEKTRGQFIQFMQARLPSGIAAEFDITFPTPTAAAVSCQKEMDELLVKTTIRFKTASAAVSSESLDLLRKLAAAAQICPKVKIKVVGHTDAYGSEDYNLKLSQGRAQAVAGRLIELGVEKERIITIGYGESRPVADNATEDGRALNRRIEFIVTED